MARSEAYHPLRNSVHVQDGGCSLLLTCTAPDSVSAVSLPPFLLSPKRPCPFQDENGDAARSVATPVLSVPTVYHHHTPITPAVLFATKRVAVVVRGTKVGARWNTLPAISPHLFAGSLENKRSRISR